MVLELAMVKGHYRTSKSFIGKTPVILVLLGIIPYLLVIYLFVYERLNVTSMVLLMSALSLFSLLTGYSLMRRSADHLVQLARETADVRAGLRDTPINISADEELNDIAESFNAMMLKLNDVNQEIKEQSVQLMIYGRDLACSYQQAKDEEQLRNRLSRYVGDNLIDRLINSQNALFPENERREVSILFADIRSFSTFSERMEVEEVVTMLNQFFSCMVDIVFRNNGILDKFIGDEIMAVFGVISPHSSGASEAVKTALEMQAATELLMGERTEARKETFDIGIGINTGFAILGNVGSENRMDYTVIGDSVNVAARLERMAKAGEIIIGEETYRQTSDHFATQARGEIAVKNKARPIVCYNVLREVPLQKSPGEFENIPLNKGSH